MRVAALYDIHGNLPALEAVLHDMRQADVDQVVVGGDVLPGPRPRETFRCLLDLDLSVHFIHGNGELAVLAHMAAIDTGSVTYWGTTSGAPLPEPLCEGYRWTAQQLQLEYEPVLARAQETGGPVLEIACGTGRVSIPIARLGFAVTGLDIVPGMLDLTRSKSAGLPTRWVEGDARTFDLGEQFRLIFLTGNAFQAFLTRADQEALLECVRVPARRGIVCLRDSQPRWVGSRSNLPVPSASDGVLLRSGNEITETLGYDLWANLETRNEEEAW